LMDYLTRDRRWCQGNLQHLRVVFAQGLTLPSRLHLAMGIMSYVSSPLWLLLLIVSTLDMLSFKAPPGASFVGFEPSLPLMVSHAAELGVLVLATVALLYGPKILAVTALLEDAEATRAHGGTGAVLWSAALESLFSTLMAPIVMLQHSWYVISILMGMATGWNVQTRSDRALPLGLVARKFAPHTVIGAAATIFLWQYASGSFDWFIPLLAGLLLAIPLVVLSSSPLLGRLAREEHLFLVPSETRGSRVLRRAHALAAQHDTVSGDPRLVVENPAVRALHLALLGPARPPVSDPARLSRLREKAQARDMAGFSRDDWALLLSDAEALKAL
jgi:membrane glycosyltransferase